MLGQFDFQNQQFRATLLILSDNIHKQWLNPASWLDTGWLERTGNKQDLESGDARHVQTPDQGSTPPASAGDPKWGESTPEPQGAVQEVRCCRPLFRSLPASLPGSPSCLQMLSASL